VDELVTQRPVGEGDEEHLRRVYASTRAEELALVDWDASVKESFLRQQFDAQDAHYRTYPDASLDVIDVNGEPAGRLYVARWADEIRIMDIALLPEYRGRGIGTKLLEALLEEAAAEGKRLTIHVEKFNPARRLYERLGFSEAGDTGVYLLLEATPRLVAAEGAAR
jgi:GNAT superfamily N-acetyltransferase